MSNPPDCPRFPLNPAAKQFSPASSVTFTSAGSSPNDQSIQWYVSNNSGNSYSAIAGANSSSYTFTAAASNAGNQFIVRYTDLSGSINSSSAVLTVDFAPSVTVQPVTQAVTVGTTKSAVHRLGLRRSCCDQRRLADQQLQRNPHLDKRSDRKLQQRLGYDLYLQLQRRHCHTGAGG